MQDEARFREEMFCQVDELQLYYSSKQNTTEVFSLLEENCQICKLDEPLWQWCESKQESWSLA